MRGWFLAIGLLMGALAPVPVLQTETTTKTFFILKTEITGRSFLKDEYGELIKTLNEAKAGDEVIIILENNRGGRISSMLDIIAAMARTKATVWTKSIGYAHSCALDILLFGDMVLIPYGQSDLAHLTSNYRSQNDYLIVKLQYFKKFLSPQEYKDFINDGDVYVSTTDMCNRVGTPSIVEGYCVVRNRRL